MTKIYCIEAIANDGDGSTWRWPVCWRLDPDDAKTVLETCDRQRHELFALLEPIYQELSTISERRRNERSAFRMRGRSGKSKGIDDSETAFQAKKDRLERKEAQIWEDWFARALDPLFPTPAWTTGFPEIKYHLIEFLDDPREVGEVELMRMRARVHTASHDDRAHTTTDDDGPYLDDY